MRLTKKNIALAIPAIFYLLFLILWMRASPIDSDYANLVLEANDIINGNVFLSDWNLTGISFLTTDLLFFTAGTLVCGISIWSYFIAAGLMIFTLVLLGFLLCEPKKRTPAEKALYFLLCGVPCTWALWVLRAHTAMACWSFLAIWLISRERGEHKNSNLILTGIALTLGCLGDSVCLLVGVLPIAIVCGIDMISEPKTQDAKGNLRILAALGCAVIASTILDKLYFQIGGAYKNQFVTGVSFEPVENWRKGLLIYVKSIFMLVDADFFNKPLTNIRTLRYFVNAVLVLLGFHAMGRSIRKYVTQREESDFISVTLSIGILLVSLLFILANVGPDEHSSRYFAYVLCSFSVLIVRNWKETSVRFCMGKHGFLVLLLLLSLVSSAFRIASVAKFSEEEQEQKRLGSFLASNGLEAGYASFWYASSTTVLSNNQVRVRAIIPTQELGGLRMYKWFCKNAWYTEKSSFVVAMQNDPHDITPESVLRTLGEADQTLYFERFTIFVYDRDLSKDLANGIADGVLEPLELYSSGETALTPEGYTLYPGSMLYGPYDTIEPGEYTLTWYGDNLDQLYADLYSSSLGRVEPETVSVSEDRLVCRVTIPRFLWDIEFRELNSSQEPVVFDRLTVEKTA